MTKKVFYRDEKPPSRRVRRVRPEDLQQDLRGLQTRVLGWSEDEIKRANELWAEAEKSVAEEFPGLDASIR